MLPVTAVEIDPRRLYRVVGLRIRDEREKRGLRQEQLAEKVGVGRTSITHIERGDQRLLLHVLYRIADALDLNLGDLLPAPAEVQSVEPIAAAPKSRREWAESVIAGTSDAQNVTKH